MDSFSCSILLETHVNNLEKNFYVLKNMQLALKEVGSSI